MAPTNRSIPTSMRSGTPQTLVWARCSFTPVASTTTWSRSSRKLSVGPTLTPSWRGARRDRGGVERRRRDVLEVSDRALARRPGAAERPEEQQQAGEEAEVAEAVHDEGL